MVLEVWEGFWMRVERGEAEMALVLSRLVMCRDRARWSPTRREETKTR